MTAEALNCSHGVAAAEKYKLYLSDVDVFLVSLCIRLMVEVILKFLTLDHIEFFLSLFRDFYFEIDANSLKFKQLY